VQKANIRHDPYDGLAIDLQQNAQHAVGRRMLRPHIQDHGSILAGLKHWSGRKVSHG
jgi:hypothetical protein